MLLDMLGRMSFCASGGKSGRFLALLTRERFSVNKLVEKNGVFTGEVSFYRKKKLEQLCTQAGMTLVIVQKKGLVFRLWKFRSRWGIALGAVLAVVMITVLSNLQMRIKIIGGDEALDTQIRAVLADCGMTTGTFLPAADYRVLEYNLTSKLDGVAWAGVYNRGSTLVVAVSRVTAQPDIAQKRLPTNIVASHDGEIVSAEVYTGKLVKFVGSGVRKGDVLVSGAYEIAENQMFYARSKAKIMAKYEDTVTFTQPFSDERKITGSDDESRRFLSVYDADLPLFFGEAPAGNYDETETAASISFLGITLPVGITTVHYEPYTFAWTCVTADEAMAEVNRLADTYKANFLADGEILAESRDERLTDTGAELTMTFTVIRDIAEEQVILAPKNAVVKKQKAK
ncbi:MAG: sporulation protein YqfD [Oscillospiraceae bacterium]